jgi:hypothetical protein
MDSIVNAEAAWKDFLRDVVVPSPDMKDRFVRINPDIGKRPPQLDAVSDLEELMELTKRALDEPKMDAMIWNVSLSLIASTFYFHVSSTPKFDPNLEYICTGMYRPFARLPLHTQN